ncbi:MAG: cell division ATP-binding protein FtsE [Deltaproteobacteria bacterium]|nr:cell division ATP-binding protein FtsE [Deltaproteobacteria bacterium]
MIRLYRVTRRYGPDVTALDEVSFEVEPGELVFLTGPSGAGKTTLFRILTLAERPDDGQALVCGRNVSRLERREVPLLRRQLGVVFQDFKLLPRRSVLANVGLALAVRGVDPRTRAERVGRLLAALELDGRARTPVERLSGGEQQRVAIARALVGEPALLLADEPTGSVDPIMALDIMRLFERANAQGTTVLIATHDVALARKLGHRRVEIARGRVRADLAFGLRGESGGPS